MLYVNPQLQPGYKDFALTPGSAKREAQALKEFEQLFLFQMLKEMRKTVQESGLMGDGMKRSYFEEMMDDVVAGEMAASGQFGIAKQMAAEMQAKISRIPPAFADRPATAGIPLRDALTGIAVPVKTPPSFEIPPSSPGVPLWPAGGAAPAARAHSSYLENQ